MKILHYLPDIDKSSGGVLRYVQVLMKTLGQSIELHLLTCHTADEMEVTGCNVHYLSVRYIPSWNTKREFMNILEMVNPDIFHTNSCWIPTSAYTAIWAKEFGCKVVYTPHGMLEPWILNRHYWLKKLPALLLYQRRAIRKADLLHATSDGEMHNLLSLGYNDNVCIIPNPIDTKVITLKRNWHRTNHILYLGRVHEKKGIRNLLDVVSEQRQLLKGYVVDIVGDSDIEQSYLKAELMQHVKQLNIDDIVKFHDGVYGADEWDFFHNADVFVLPTYSENFGIVVAEALACGVPVITTQGTPWKELETHNCGWWIEIGTEPLKVALLDFMKKSEAELEQMGRNGRKLVEEKYSSERIAEQFLDMYKKLADKN